MKKAFMSKAKKALSWIGREGGEFADNLSRDMRSMRALWNIIYLALFAFLCVWAALYHAQNSLNTAIVTTGGLVGTIFTGYVWSKTVEKRDMVAKVVVQEEKGESD